MGTRKRCSLPACLERVQRRFEHWRQTRKIPSRNVRSRIVRQLIVFLRRQPDGYDSFRRMGLVRRPPEREVWRRAEVNDLVGCLRRWSSKQVRMHFEQLRRAGMITAERERGNGPWRYLLPEDLTARSNAFRGLPVIQGRPNPLLAR
jgi:hypothetical protein